MARRLTPEARRAEIVEVAHAVITEEGYRALSLRELARRCEMSAPGLMHYFPDMPSLLHAVLERRDQTDIAAIFGETSDASMLEMVDEGLAYYAVRPDETRQFDALEAEAIDPTHPAHEYFVRRDDRTFELLRPHLEREFVEPDRAMVLLRLISDGFRFAQLRDPSVNRVAEWAKVRDVAFAGLERRADAERAREADVS